MSKRRWILSLIFALVIVLIIFSFQLIKINEYWGLRKFWIMVSYSFRRDKRQTSLTKHSLSHWSLAQPRDQNLCIYDWMHSDELILCAWDWLLHRKNDVGAGWNDKRVSSSWPYDGRPPVVRSVGLAAATATADDHEDDEDKRAANHSSLLHIRHVIPPGKDTYQLCKSSVEGLN